MLRNHSKPAAQYRLFVVVGFVLFWMTGGCSPESKRSADSNMNDSKNDERIEDQPSNPKDSNQSGNKQQSEDQTLQLEMKKSQSEAATRDGINQLKDGNISEAVRNFRTAIEIDNQNHEALFQVMQVLDSRGQQRVIDGNRAAGYQDLVDAGNYAKQLIDTRTAILLDENNVVLLGNALYNAACGNCYFKKKDEALSMIGLAMTYRFDRPELLKTDPDLEFIRNEAKFKELLSRDSAKEGKSP